MLYFSAGVWGKVVEEESEDSEAAVEQFQRLLAAIRGLNRWGQQQDLCLQANQLVWPGWIPD